MADTCTVGTINCSLISYADVFNNVALSLGPFQRLITGVAYIIGCAFIFKAIYSLKIYGEARTMTASHASVKEPLIYLFVGVIFIFLPTGVDLTLQTAFGANAHILAYGPINSTGGAFGVFAPGSPVGRPLAMLIQVVGLIAFIRGWILIARASGQGQQPGGTGKGFMHVFGGILALNIVQTLSVINATLYG